MTAISAILSGASAQIDDRRDLPIAAGMNLMSNSLRSFSAFVPVGIVRQLVNSGRPLTLRRRNPVF